MARDKIPNPIEIAKLSSTPGTNSASGYILLYPKSDGLWYGKDGSGAETLIAQPLDSDLTAIAGLSPADDDIIQRKSGAWTNRTMAQLLTDLGVMYRSGIYGAPPVMATVADASTYYLGPNAFSTSYDGIAISTPLNTYISRAGTIKAAKILYTAGTTGTSENISIYIRLNNTTDTLIQTVGTAAATRIFTNNSLSISLAEGDYFTIKVVHPTWATNVANVRILWTVDVEYNAY